MRRIVAYAGSFLSREQCRKLGIDAGYAAGITNKLADPPPDRVLAAEGFIHVPRSAAGQARWRAPNPSRKSLEDGHSRRVQELEAEIAQLKHELAGKDAEIARVRREVRWKAGEP